MNIFKKIVLGAVLIITGLFIIPQKALAGDPTPTPTGEIIIDDTTGKITYNVTGCNGCTLNVKVTIGAGAATDADSIELTSDPATGELTMAMNTLLNSSVTANTEYKVSATVDPKSTGITAPVIADKTGMLYVGKVVAASGSTHLSGVDGADVTHKTLSVNDTYNNTVTVTGAPYYILSKTVGAGSPEAVNKVQDTISNKISEGDVVITEGEASIVLETAPSTVKKTGYSSGVSINPSEAPYYVSKAEVTDVALTSATGKVSKAEASFNTAGNVVNIDVDGIEGTTATAKLKLTAEQIPTGLTFSKEYDFNITIESSKPDSVEIYGETIIYVGEDPEIYEAEVFPVEFAGHTVTWAATQSPKGTTVATAKKLADQTLEITPKAAGTVTLTATVDGVKSEQFVITVLKAPEIVTDVIVTGPEQISVGKGSSATYKAQVLLDTGKNATNQKVTWEVDDDTLATISSSGVLTLTELAEVGDTIYILATSVEDDTVSSDLFAVEVIDIATVDSFEVKTSEITLGYTIDMAVGKNLITNPSDSAKNIKSIEWTPSDAGGVITIKNNDSNKVTFTGKKAGVIKLTPTVTYTNGTTDTLDEMEFSVYDDKITKPEFGSGDKLSFTLPESAYTSHDISKNIDEVTGYQIDVLKKDGTVLYTVTKSGTENISIDGDTIEDYVEKAGASGKLSGDKEEITIRVSPRGKSQKDGKTVTNTDAGLSSDTKTIYRVSIPDSTYINGAYVYGLADHEVTITASPKSNYKFANWDDGSTSVTRKVKVSTDTSKNVYKANANTTGTPSTTNGTTNKNSSNSNLDKVPRTGESMAIYWVIMVAVISGSIVAAVLYKCFAPKARKWKGGDTDNNDSCMGK